MRANNLAAKQIELAFSYDVDWVGNREVITDVFVLDLVFCNIRKIWAIFGR
jgi:hypothetical protein